MRALATAILTLILAGCGGGSPDRGPGSDAVVARVLDGDTIVLADGRHVRLVQLDAPERHGECYGRAAARVLRNLLPPGTAVKIQQDPALDQVDEYARILAYVQKGSTNINLELVRAGAAAPWFFHGSRGRYAPQLLEDARAAQKEGRGLWSACPHTVLDPLHAVDARR
jgi:micrococcal nuclease